MKKLGFLFVAVAAIAFASCGNKANSNTETTPEVEVVEEVVTVEPVEEAAVCDSTAMEVVTDTTVVVAE